MASFAGRIELLHSESSCPFTSASQVATVTHCAAYYLTVFSCEYCLVFAVVDV